MTNINFNFEDWLDFHNYDIEIPVNRFSFFKQLDIISDWACGEYGFGNVDDNSEINSWKMPSFDGNGIDDRERRGSILVSISRRGLEVADALHQMKVAQEVLDGARDSKTMKYTHYVQNESHLGIDKIEGNTKDELIASLFAHISSTSGYHEITKKEAVEEIIENDLEDYQYPDSLSKDLEARDSKYMVVSSQDGDEFGACQVQGSGKYRFVIFKVHKHILLHK